MFSEYEKQALYKVIYTRRDVRTFLSQKIPDEVILNILNAAHHGPSKKNDIRDLLKIPFHIDPIALISIGYTEDYPVKPILESENWGKRNNIKDLIFKETWGKPHNA